MLENPEQNDGIESERDAGGPEIKLREQIRARCLRTRNKRKGSNPGAIPEISNQNEGIESERDTGEHETKGRD